MTDNVVKLQLVTVGPAFELSCDQVLEAAKGVLDQVLVIGIDKDGYTYAAGARGSIGDAMFLLEKAKIDLLCGNLKPCEVEPGASA